MENVTSFLPSLWLLCCSLALGPGLASAAAPQVPASPGPSTGEASVYFKDGTKLPLFSHTSDDAPVARVGGETITLLDLTEALGAVHERWAEGAQAGGKDFTATLNRLIDVRMVLLEGPSKGLTEMPQFKVSVDNYRTVLLAESLRRRIGSTARVNPAEVQRIYEKIVREWKIRSVLFEKQEGAARMESEVRAGGSFDDLARNAIDSKKAKGGESTDFVPGSKMLPQVLDVVRRLPMGQVSAPVSVPGGWALIRVDAERTGDDPKERAKIELAIANRERVEVLRKYYQSLLKKYAQVDKGLLKKLDFDVGPKKLDALAKDSRPVARIQGEPPITVAELLAQIEKRFFHGLKEAANQKKLNARKQVTLDDMLERRLFLKEALALKLNEDPTVVRQVRDQADKIVFSAVLERAVLPEVRVTDEETKAYYDKHQAEFSSPALVRLAGLAFVDGRSARGALEKVKAGTDFKWLAANASGQVEAAKRTLEFQTSPVTVASLPPGLASALTGARQGDYRLYSASDGEQYLVRVIEEIAPTLQPLEDVKEGIGKKLYAEKANAAFIAWVAKLRPHYKPEILITRIGQ